MRTRRMLLRATTRGNSVSLNAVVFFLERSGRRHFGVLSARSIQQRKKGLPARLPTSLCPLPAGASPCPELSRRRGARSGSAFLAGKKPPEPASPCPVLSIVLPSSSSAPAIGPYLVPSARSLRPELGHMEASQENPPVPDPSGPFGGGGGGGGLRRHPDGQRIPGPKGCRDAPKPRGGERPSPSQASPRLASTYCVPRKGTPKSAGRGNMQTISYGQEKERATFRDSVCRLHPLSHFGHADAP
ncbi:translation initiation factor IF-2-like [Gracilinanus agilis]|uniref:translation initiation factor IF-2-like n=1 Tax=Gracilinanus agilis TaxID=191870 RepID=UPI001CFD16A0|nr:translation initiation factor IF-2-like [Gracilinanus agilis]